jgi:hypothetical protein
MDQWLQAIREQLSDHGIKYLTAAGFTLAGWLAARWKAARDWRKREFFNRLNVFLNSLAAQRLIQAAQKTTPDNPFIPIRNEDRWFYLNAVLNELSERFANGLFRREAGLPVNAQRFLICLTNEADGDVRTRKIRAMVIRKDLLENLPDTPQTLEKPTHRVRWKTLQLMQQKWKSDPTLFIEVEVVV